MEGGGTISLGTEGLLASNSSMRTNWFSPPVWQVEALSLLGERGRSYWIEARDVSLPESEWTRFQRVAMTIDVRPLGMTLAPNLAFRIREFVADPPVLELRRFFGGPSLQIVLFGARTNAYVLESSSSLDAQPGGWSIDSTVTLTNSFHFFLPMTADEPARFFRVRKN